MIIAGTGHRPDKLGGYGDEVKHALDRVATSWLASNRPAGVISGMALGWDQALARAAISLGIPLLAALPFKDQDCKWPARSREDFADILGKAMQVVVVSEGGYSAHKMQLRNEYMVDKCDSLLALWNGAPGGTANCVSYANRVGRPVTNLWSSFRPGSLPEAFQFPWS